MIRLAFSALLMIAPTFSVAQSSELSPWFGSVDTAEFQLELMPGDPAIGPAMSAAAPMGDCQSVCPNPPKFAIVTGQGLAKAP
jgi:hypothetical protein